MRRIVLYSLLCIMLCACLSSCVRDTSTLKPVTGFDLEQYPGFVLAWHDEFSQDGRPDPNHWAYEKGFVRNDELQWYQPDNARCENGMLIIEARREQKPNPNYLADSRNWKQSRAQAEYTSSSTSP